MEPKRNRRVRWSSLLQVAWIDIEASPWHRCCMRTTSTVDDDVLEPASRQAKLRGVSLGRAVSNLLRKGLNAAALAQSQDGLVMFQLPADSPEVPAEDVRRIEAEGL